MVFPRDDKEWFACWFNSPYYHILYADRDLQEAEAFIGTLVKKLPMPAGSRVLDLACGKGRHSVTLHQLGMNVTGVDLSSESIAAARKHEKPGLEFYEHDMRRPFRINYYDYILNLFTSFGYFESERDNAHVISSVHSGLKEGGVFILDFFNGAKVEQLLSQPYDLVKTIGGVTFNMHKYLHNRHVYKEIRFTDGGQDYFFTERVQLLTAADLERLLGPQFKILHLHGSYALDPFDEKTSERLIVTAQKIPLP